jgi:hypothetical protein
MNQMVDKKREFSRSWEESFPIWASESFLVVQSPFQVDRF